MSLPVIVCQVCDTALDRRTDASGVSYVHTLASLPVDHEPIPVEAGPGWRGRCDFCFAPGAEYVVPARDFTLPDTVPGLPVQSSLGDWAACSMCALLVDTNRWNNLVQRAATYHQTRHGKPMPETATARLRKVYRLLRANITGSPRPAGGGR